MVAGPGGIQDKAQPKVLGPQPKVLGPQPKRPGETTTADNWQPYTIKTDESPGGSLSDTIKGTSHTHRTRRTKYFDLMDSLEKKPALTEKQEKWLKKTNELLIRVDKRYEGRHREIMREDEGPIFLLAIGIMRLSQDCETARINVVNLAKEIKASPRPRLKEKIDGVKASKVSVCITNAFARFKTGMAVSAERRDPTIDHTISKAPTSGDDRGLGIDGFMLAGRAVESTLNAAGSVLGGAGSVLGIVAHEVGLGISAFCEMWANN